MANSKREREENKWKGERKENFMATAAGIKATSDHTVCIFDQIGFLYIQCA